MICITTPVSAYSFPDLTLKVVKECNIKYAGDSCETYLDLNNETGKVLDGEAMLSVGYNGECKNTSLEGIGAQFSIVTNDLKKFPNWENNISSISDFKINTGNSKLSININSIPNLCPGQYTFNFQIIGKNGIDEYTTPPIVINSNSAVGGQYNTNYILELQIQILKLKIQIMNVLIQLKNMGRVILNF